MCSITQRGARRHMPKNESKRINLSIPQQILEKLNEEKEKLAYTSHQEIILQVLREHYFKPKLSFTTVPIQKKNQKEKRGRPPKLDPLKIIGAKRIFSKKGKPYPI